MRINIAQSLYSIYLLRAMQAQLYHTDTPSIHLAHRGVSSLLLGAQAY